MSTLAQPHTQTSITYELPLNDPMRICLRLEHLFKQLKYFTSKTEPSSSRSAILALVRILNVIDRPDLKSKLTQTLTQHATMLNQLRQSNHVDQQRLQQLLNNLNQQVDHLHQLQHKMGERLRKNEFLNQIRLRLNNPAGVCEHSSPMLELWLRCPAENRQRDLHAFSHEFENLHDIADIILTITRQCTPSKTVLAEKGYYQQTLEANAPCELIRVSVPTELGVYPEISAGKHRVIVRFLQAHFLSGSPQQATSHFQFQLSCCKI